MVVGWLVWSVWAVCLALVGAGLVLLFATTDSFALEWKTPGGRAATAAWVLVYVVFSSVGALVVSRRVAGVVGWLCLAIGVTQAASFCAARYAAHALFQASSPLPAGEWAAWLGTWLGAPTLGEIALLLLLFPDGRPPSPRWRPVAWAGGVVVAMQTLALMFRPGPTPYSLPDGYMDNPAGIEALRGTSDIVTPLAGLGAMLFLLAAVLALALRFRGARGPVRRQIKMVAAAGGGFVVALAAILVAIGLGVAGEGRAGVFATLVPLVLPLGLIAIPTAIGLALLPRSVVGRGH